MAPASYHVTLMSTRADIPTVLAAYAHAAEIRGVLFDHCQLRALPPDFATRFPAVDDLSWTDDAIDGAAVRGLLCRGSPGSTSRARRCASCAPRTSPASPRLEELALADTPLAALAPEIIDACPSLARVTITNTPLAANEPALAVLRARWPSVAWS